MLPLVKKISQIFKGGWMKPPCQTKECRHSVLILAIAKVIEDAVLWRKNWLSVVITVFANLSILFMAFYGVGIVQFTLFTFICHEVINAFEAWLRSKHRISFLNKLAQQNELELNNKVVLIKAFFEQQCSKYLHLRNNNHPKAFLLTNIVMIITIIVGYNVNGYLLAETFIMAIIMHHKVGPHFKILLNKVKLCSDYDEEFDNLIPEVSDVDMKYLLMEPENLIDEKQSLDYWKPEDNFIEEGSDSSQSSGSMMTNLSAEKLPKIENDSDTSDDEYMPRGPHLQSTLTETDSQGAWGDAAYNVLQNVTSMVTSVYTKPNARRERVSSTHSSDGFEIIDKNDLQ